MMSEQLVNFSSSVKRVFPSLVLTVRCITVNENNTVNVRVLVTRLPSLILMENARPDLQIKHVMVH